MNAEFDYADQARFASLEAEQSVLGALMLDNSSIDRIDGLTADHFTRPDHQSLFRMISFMIQNGQQCDVLTVFDVIQRKNKIADIADFPYLNALVTSVSSSAHIKQYAKIIIDRAQLRCVRDATNEINVAIVEQGLSGEEAILKASEVLGSIEDAEVNAEVSTQTDISSYLMKDLQDRLDGVEPPVVKTGIDHIDQFFKMERGDFVVIGARPSIGKTAAACTLAMSMTKKNHGIFFSLEMTKSQIGRRNYAIHSGVPANSLRTGIEANNENDWNLFSESLDSFNDLKLVTDDRPNLHVNQIAAACRKYKRKNKKLDFIIVDHFLKMNHGKDKDRLAGMENSSNMLHALAKQLDMVVICLTQLNRNVTDRTGNMPHMSDLKSCGAIEQDASSVILLHRPEYYLPNKEAENPAERGYAMWIFDKVRDGEVGVLHMELKKHIGKFVKWVGEIPDGAGAKDKPYKKSSSF